MPPTKRPTITLVRDLYIGVMVGFVASLASLFGSARLALAVVERDELPNLVQVLLPVLLTQLPLMLAVALFAFGAGVALDAPTWRVALGATVGAQLLPAAVLGVTAGWERLLTFGAIWPVAFGLFAGVFAAGLPFHWARRWRDRRANHTPPASKPPD